MGLERVESPRCQYIITQFFACFIPLGEHTQLIFIVLSVFSIYLIELYLHKMFTNVGTSIG